MVKRYTEEQRKAARAITNRKYYLKTRLTLQQQKEMKAILSVIQESKSINEKIRQTSNSGFSKMKQVITNIFFKLTSSTQVI